MYVGVPKWTRTWWSGVDDKKVKEGKRLGYSAGLCAPGNQPESEIERERERRTWGPKSLVEQACFIDFCVSIYTVLQGSFFR